MTGLSVDSDIRSELNGAMENLIKQEIGVMAHVKDNMKIGLKIKLESFEGKFNIIEKKTETV